MDNMVKESISDSSPKSDVSNPVSLENYFIDFGVLNDWDDCKNKSKRHSKFNKKFLQLRSNLKMEKVTRKSQFDSLLKKTKAKVFRVIHDSIKKCLVPGFRLLRLPQNFITNIKIEFNKKCLKKTVLEIYIENEIILSIDELFENNLVKPGREEIFKEFMNLTLLEVHEYYITSKQYLTDRERIAEKESEKFSILFAFIAQHFIDYYLQSKGNQPKTSQANKKGSSCSSTKNDTNINLSSSSGRKKFFKVN
jgi:hypothetical protein